MTLSSDGDFLTGAWFEGQRCRPKISAEAAWVLREDLPVFTETRSWLDDYFRGGNPPSDSIRIAPAGTEFRKHVWKMLCEIPYGETVTYGGIAEKFCKENSDVKASPRAVGGAVGRNPIAVIIPCHRVLGKGGRLCGYAGGLSRKAALLQLEKSLLV